MLDRLYNLLARFGGNIGFVGSGIHCLSSQSLSKSSKNWFEKRTSGGTFQNNSKSRKQLILRHLRDFSFYNNPLFAPHLLHKSILTFFLAVFLTVIRKLTVIAFMKYLNIPSLRKTRLVSIHGNSNLNVCSSND